MENELVRQHLPLVNYIVNEMASRVPRHVPRSDLESAGMEGLAQAARGFDPDRGSPFERYAARRIKGAMIDELRRTDWATRSVRSRSRRMKAAAEELTAKLNRPATAAEIAAHSDMHVDEVNSLTGDLHRAIVLSFNALPDHVGEQAVMASGGQGADSSLLVRERQAYLIDAIEALAPRLRRVVIGYFFEERPMLELAEELGVTESRISQMRAEAIVLLRDGINSQLDPDMVPAPTKSREARRRAAYYAAVASGSDYRARLSPQTKGFAPTRAETSA